MKLSDVMTRDPKVISPDAPVRRAAELMDELNVGVLPVCNGEKLVGMITDRDITVRGTAVGGAPDDVKVSDVMSADVRWCYEDADVEEAQAIMKQSQIRRLPVIDRQKRLVGIVALGDLATDGAKGAGETLEQISNPSQPDR